MTSETMLWPVGAPERERHGPTLPAGWGVAIGFDVEYWLGVHTGVDLNLPGDRDLGVPCYAVADGVVTWAGPLPGTWGNVVLLRHPALGLWSQYAHLAAVGVRVGQHVEQGAQIATVGNGAVLGQHGPTVSAHLHFEIRKTDLPAGRWPSGAARSTAPSVHAFVRANYEDPMKLLGR